MKAINYAYMVGVIEGSSYAYDLYHAGIISLDQVERVNEFLRKKFKEAESKALEYTNK